MPAARGATLTAENAEEEAAPAAASSGRWEWWDLASTMPLRRRERRTRHFDPAHPMVTAANVLRILGVVLLVFVFTAVVVTPVNHTVAQHRLYQLFRQRMAEGTLPMGPMSLPPLEEQGAADSDGQVKMVPTPVGDPVALIEFPDQGLKEVVVEGTGARETARGIGHKRDTVLPGHPGISVLIGRASMFGGVLGDLDRVSPGQRFTVTTGQGAFQYEVMGLRRPGDRMPPARAKGEGRLTLMTASGGFLRPEDVLRVDARLIGTAQPADHRIVSLAPPEERVMAGGDSTGLMMVLVLVMVMAIVLTGLAWAWKRWGKVQTWIVGSCVLLSLGVLASLEVIYLLPNVM